MRVHKVESAKYVPTLEEGAQDQGQMSLKVFRKGFLLVPARQTGRLHTPQGFAKLSPCVFAIILLQNYLQTQLWYRV